MGKFFRILVIMAVFVFAACSHSNTEKFVTVGDYDAYRFSDDEDEYCKEDYYRGYPKSASNAASAYYTMESKSVERDIAESESCKIDGNILWLLHEYKGLVAVDISDPENLKTLGSVTTGGYWYNGEMYFQDGRVYILLNNLNNHYGKGFHSYSTKSADLLVIDTTDPRNLSILGEFEIDGWVTDSKLNGDFFYAVVSESSEHWYYCNGEEETSGSDQISIMSLDVKNPQNIKITDKVLIAAADNLVYFSEKSVYVAESGKRHLTMFDISDPEGKIVEKSTFATAGIINSLEIHETDDVVFAVTYSLAWGSIIESFDISDPANVRQLDELTFNGETFAAVKFEGGKIYAASADYSSKQLYIIDISDPLEIKEQGKTGLTENADYLEIHGKKLFAVTEGHHSSAVSLYSIADPENPQPIGTIKLPEDSECGENDIKFQIFDEPGVILVPLNCHGEFHWPVESYKLYIVDFDDKGLKTRGFIESDTEVKEGVAIHDSIFSINNTRIVTADATKRDHLKILSEYTFATNVASIEKCGKLLCDFNDLRLTAYDSGNLKKIWESTHPSGNDYGAGMVSNSNYGYIFLTRYSGIDFVDDHPDFDAKEISKESRRTIKTVKFSDDGKFEETDEIPFKIKASLGSAIALENNVIAINATKYTEKNDGSGCYKKESKIIFLNMNDTKNGIKWKDLDFNYKTIDAGSNFFVSGTTLWKGGCKLKEKDPENEELARYYCYAVPFDVSDPKNPKMGKAVNIPGELVGISDDGQYLYTRTPAITEYGDCPADDGFYCRTNSRFYDFYILKFNDSKTDVEIVKKEPMGYFANYMKSMEDEANFYDTTFSRTDTVSHKAYIKNNNVFFVKNTSREEKGVDLTGCSEYDSRYEAKLISTNGEELPLESFENALGSFNSVEDGGFLVSTEGGLKYIDENGKSQIISDNLDSRQIYFQNSLFLNGKIYIPVGWDGIYSFDVK